MRYHVFERKNENLKRNTEIARRRSVCISHRCQVASFRLLFFYPITLFFWKRSCTIAFHSKLKVDVQSAKLLIFGAILRCVRTALTLAAALGVYAVRSFCSFVDCSVRAL
jgi:hypothetical protein